MDQVQYHTFNSFEDETDSGAKMYLSTYAFQFLWGWNLNNSSLLWTLRLTFNSFEDETREFFVLDATALLTFNSFEDETSLSRSGEREWEDLTFNSFEDETEQGHLFVSWIPTFNSFEDETGRSRRMVDSNRTLSIPLRMKQVTDEEGTQLYRCNFQFLWGWNLKALLAEEGIELRAFNSFEDETLNI